MYYRVPFVVLFVCLGLILQAGVRGFGDDEPVVESSDREVEVDEQREIDPEAIERRLDEIEKLIDDASEANDKDRLGKLRREGERLLDQLEAFERAQIIDEESGEDEEFEELERETRRLQFHKTELEYERAHLELRMTRQEAAIRQAKIAEDKYASVSFALIQATEEIEPAEGIEYLEDILKSSQDAVVTRMIRLRLAELCKMSGRSDVAAKHFRALILSE